MWPDEFADVATPGVIVSNAWPDSRETEGATARAIEEVVENHPFFEAFQTVDIPSRAERLRVQDLLKNSGRPHTYTLTRVFAEHKANLSSLDAAERRRATDLFIRCMDDACECGATAVCMVSGARPAEPSARGEALRGFEESMARVCEAAKSRGVLVEIEPLDYEVHKRGTLGTTDEAVAMCERLVSSELRMGLCIDTAHLILNGEDVIESVAKARPHISALHFCNPVTDRGHPQFGDNHIPFGPPGVVDLKKITGWMRSLSVDGFLTTESRPPVFCEVWRPGNMTSMEVVASCEQILREAWSLARATPTGGR